jgi:glutaredoxin
MMIEIYGTPTCGFCIRAKKLAERHQIAYEYKDISANQTNRDELTERMGSEPRQVPQIFWNNKYVGGYEQLNAEIENTRNFGDGAF